MQTDTLPEANGAERTRTARGWIWPVLFIAGFALAIVLSGLHRDTGIHNMQEYRDGLREAQTLSTDPMTKVEQGKDLAPSDVQNLRKAVAIYDDLEVFQPEEMGPYLVGGRIHLALGELTTAELNFKQAIDDSGLEAKGSTEAAVHALAASAHDYLSEVYTKENRSQEALIEANQAISMDASVTAFYFDRAQAEIQLKQVSTAAADLRHVIVQDPNNTRAAGLLQLLLDSKRG